MVWLFTFTRATYSWNKKFMASKWLYKESLSLGGQKEVIKPTWYIQNIGSTTVYFSPRNIYRLIILSNWYHAMVLIFGHPNGRYQNNIGFKSKEMRSINVCIFLHYGHFFTASEKTNKTNLKQLNFAWIHK